MLEGEVTSPGTIHSSSHSPSVSPYTPSPPLPMLLTISSKSTTFRMFCDSFTTNRTLTSELSNAREISLSISFNTSSSGKKKERRRKRKKVMDYKKICFWLRPWSSPAGGAAVCVDVFAGRAVLAACRERCNHRMFKVI